MKILIISEVGWGFLRQRHHEVALHFASKGWDVTFIGPTLFRIPKIKRIYNKIIYLLKKVASRKNTTAELVKIQTPHTLRVKKSFIIPNTLFKLWNFLYSKYVLRIANFDLIYSFTPSVNEIIYEKSIWARTVFDIIHNWWDIPFKPFNFDNNFKFLLHNVGAIVTDSSDIFSRLERDHYIKPKYLMLPGVNLPKNYVVKPPNNNENTLKFLFFGNLRQNSDVELLNKLADVPNLLVTVIGIIDQIIIKDLSKAIIYGGSVNQEKIFEISTKFDGILLPYKNDKFSMTISPAKFFECLAMSRLIITRSKLTIFKGYDEHILFLDDLEQINYKILRSALEKYKNNSISRINHKDQNTWIERFKGFDNFLIEEFKIG